MVKETRKRAKRFKDGLEDFGEKTALNISGAENSVTTIYKGKPAKLDRNSWLMRKTNISFSLNTPTICILRFKI